MASVPAVVTVTSATGAAWVAVPTPTPPQMAGVASVHGVCVCVAEAFPVMTRNRFGSGPVYHEPEVAPRSQSSIRNCSDVCDPVKYGPTTRQTTQPRQLIWENAAASIVLSREQVHPREPSMLEIVYKQLAEVAASRAPTAAADI